jgi:hypothetical protein
VPSPIFPPAAYTVILSVVSSPEVFQASLVLPRTAVPLVNFLRSHSVLLRVCYGQFSGLSSDKQPSILSATPQSSLSPGSWLLRGSEAVRQCRSHLHQFVHNPRGQALAEMANKAQCFYCFESLYASFEDREPASLAAIEALWEQYEQSKKLSKLADEEDEQSVNDDDDPKQSSRPSGLQIPRINRLQSQASDSSTATSPSSTSNTSSNSNLSNSTAMTTPGSRSGIPKSSEQKYPLFVTWNTLSRSGSKSLRGCIGTFEAKELAVGLKSYALTSYVNSFTLSTSLYHFHYTQLRDHLLTC